MSPKNIIIAVMMIGVILPTSAAAFQDWEKQVLELRTESLGAGPRSLAVDAAGNIHMAFGKEELYYAYYNGSDWQLTMVDNSGAVGAIASIALDSKGRPGICYRQWENNYWWWRAKFAWFDGSQWAHETIEDDVKVTHTDIAYDGNDTPHVVYGVYYYENEVKYNHLRYAARNGTQWSTETLDDSGGEGCSIAIDGNNRPNVSYIKLTSPGEQLQYISYNGTSWHSEKVGSDDPVGKNLHNTCIGLTSTDRPRIAFSYYDGSEATARYASHNGTLWSVTTIAQCEYSEPSLTINPSGYSYVTYNDASDNFVCRYQDASGWHTMTVQNDSAFQASIVCNTNVHLMYRRSDGAMTYAVKSGNGFVETPVSQPDDMRYPTIGIGNQKKPHITYINHSQDTLMHTYPVAGSWQTIEIDTDVEYGASMQMDSTHLPHILYNKNGDLHYAHFNGTSWVKEKIMVGGNSVWGNGYLTLDTSDRPHFSFYQGGYWDCKCLQYGYRNGTMWQTEVVHDGATDEEVGGKSALVVYPDNRVSILYRFRDMGGHDIDYMATKGDSTWQTYPYMILGSQYPGWDLGYKLSGDSVGHIVMVDFNDRDLVYCREAPGFNTACVNIFESWDPDSVSLAIGPDNQPHVSYLTHSKHLRYSYRTKDGTWMDHRKVVSNSNGAINHDLAVDRSGTRHVAYTQGGSLKYAKWIKPGSGSFPAIFLLLNDD